MAPAGLEFPAFAEQGPGRLHLELALCRDASVPVQNCEHAGGAVGMTVGCGRLPAAVCSTGVARGVISLVPRMSAHKCICSNSRPRPAALEHLPPLVVSREWS